jgi:hypothetical protein
MSSDLLMLRTHLCAPDQLNGPVTDRSRTALEKENLKIFSMFNFGASETCLCGKVAPAHALRATARKLPASRLHRLPAPQRRNPAGKCAGTRARTPGCGEKGHAAAASIAGCCANRYVKYAGAH